MWCVRAGDSAWIVIVTFVALVGLTRCEPRTDKIYWDNLAQTELAEALKLQWNTGVAKNVIIFIGDGMGLNTVTATRIYKGGESHRLAYEMFPHMGLLKTYSADFMIPDSASTATALFNGQKVNQNTVGVVAAVNARDCEGSLNPGNQLVSLATLAQDAGKATGFVTTMRVTHATPAPLYAHSADRSWECEATMPATATACKDIARQLIEDEPGRSLNVIMGGGRQGLKTNVTASVADPLDSWGCVRQDGRDLIEDYRRDKTDSGLRYSVVQNNRDLADLNVNETDYVLGLFANGHLSLDAQRDTGPGGMPSLSDMVGAAIGVLKNNKNGFFLMVEGGNIDMTHHRGQAKKAISEAAAMEEAVRLAMMMTDDEDTLLIVTSDHSHSLAINGYAKRGSSIFGVIENPSAAGQNYTTLTYGTGGPGSSQVYASLDDQQRPVAARRDPSLDDTEDFEYHQQATIEAVEVYHGGGDVGIYARGPQSHLFHNVHEQHYVFHVISYAAKLGSHSAGSVNFPAKGLLVSVCLVLGVTFYW